MNERAIVTSVMRQADDAHKRLADMKPNEAVREVNKTIIHEMGKLAQEISLLRMELQALSSFVRPGDVAIETKTIIEISNEVLLGFPDVTLEMVRGSRGNKRVQQVRHHVWLCVRKRRPDISFPVMGKFFKRDHSSIIFAVKQLAEKEGVSIS